MISWGLQSLAPLKMALAGGPVLSHASSKEEVSRRRGRSVATCGIWCGRVGVEGEKAVEGAWGMRGIEEWLSAGGSLSHLFSTFT